MSQCPHCGSQLGAIPEDREVVVEVHGRAGFKIGVGSR